MIFKRVVTIVMLSAFLALPSYSQDSGAGVSSTKSGPRKQLSKIFLSGLGGAVLGLSTLSFYGRPQDHMSNIAIGFAIGVVFGTVYVTYDTAKRPKEYVSIGQAINPFVPKDNIRDMMHISPSVPLLTYNYLF